MLFSRPPRPRVKLCLLSLHQSTPEVSALAQQLLLLCWLLALQADVAGLPIASAPISVLSTPLAVQLMSLCWLLSSAALLGCWHDLIGWTDDWTLVMWLAHLGCQAQTPPAVLGVKVESVPVPGPLQPGLNQVPLCCAPRLGLLGCQAQTDSQTGFAPQQTMVIAAVPVTWQLGQLD